MKQATEFKPANVFPVSRSYFYNPPSFRGRNKERKEFWRRVLQDTLGLETAGNPITEPCYVHVSHYFWDGNADDVDNKAKPIMDALSKFLYTDDSRVNELTYKRIPILSRQAESDLFMLNDDDKLRIGGLHQDFTEKSDFVIVTIGLVSPSNESRWIQHSVFKAKAHIKKKAKAK